MALFRRNKKSTPTRQVTGTTYSTANQGAVKLRPADVKEAGSSAHARLIDPVPALTSDYQAARTYTQMVRSDASVRTSLRAGRAPVLGAEYSIEAFSDDPLDMVIKEFVEFNLFHGMTIPFLKTLETILKFFESPKGNSIFELCWENREWAPVKVNPLANRKQYTMLRKLGYRPPDTIIEYDYDDNGGPAGIVQLATRANKTQEEVTIPIEKLVIFVFDPDGGSIMGTSILRSAYRNYFYKDRFYAIDGVQKERHGIGVPQAELQPGADADDKAIATEMVKNLRTNENAFMVTNPKFKISFAELPGNPVDALSSAQHHDNMIMKNIMVQFLDVASSGGRATAATALDAFLKSMSYIANSICECYNMYVIPELVAYNFKTDRFPRLTVRGIGEGKDLAMFAAAISNLVKAKALTIDEETEDWVRKQLDAPQLADATVQASQVPAAPTVPVVPTDPNTNGNGKIPQGFNLGKSPSNGG